MSVLAEAEPSAPQRVEAVEVPVLPAEPAKPDPETRQDESVNNGQLAQEHGKDSLKDVAVAELLPSQPAQAEQPPMQVQVVEAVEVEVAVIASSSTAVPSADADVPEDTVDDELEHPPARQLVEAVDVSECVVPDSMGGEEAESEILPSSSLPATEVADEQDELDELEDEALPASSALTELPTTDGPEIAQEPTSGNEDISDPMEVESVVPEMEEIVPDSSEMPPPSSTSTSLKRNKRPSQTFELTVSPPKKHHKSTMNRSDPAAPLSDSTPSGKPATSKLAKEVKSFSTSASRAAAQKRSSASKSSQPPPSTDKEPETSSPAKKKGRPPKAKPPPTEAPKTSASTSSSPVVSKRTPVASTSSRLLGSQTTYTSLAGPTPRESKELRCDGWDLKRMDSLAWVCVGKDEAGTGEGRFWWPARFKSSLKSQRPLQLELFCDPKDEVLGFADKLVSLDVPSSDNILSYRSKNHRGLRFDATSFRDDDTSEGKAPSREAFEAAGLLALHAEQQDDSDDDLPMPTFQPKKAASKPDSDAEMVEIESSSSSSSSEEDDFDIPANCLAEMKGWWAARVISRVPGKRGKPKKGQKKGIKGPTKYTVEFFDGTIKTLAKSGLLFPDESRFFTVEMGATILKEPKDFDAYVAREVERIRDQLQRVINRSYPLAEDRNVAFYSGGKKRAALAKESHYGEYEDSYLEKVRKALVVAFATSEPSNSGGLKANDSVDDLPSSSALPPATQASNHDPDAFSALSKSDKLLYTSDVLLPIAIIFLKMEEIDASTIAKKEAKKEKKELSEEELEERAFEIAIAALDRGTMLKWARAARQARGIADSDKAGMAAMMDQNARWARGEDV